MLPHLPPLPQGRTPPSPGSEGLRYKPAFNCPSPAALTPTSGGCQRGTAGPRPRATNSTRIQPQHLLRGGDSGYEQGVLPSWDRTPAPLPAPRQLHSLCKVRGSRTTAGPRGPGPPKATAMARGKVPWGVCPFPGVRPVPGGGLSHPGGGGLSHPGLTSGGSRLICRRSCPRGQSPG